MKKKNLVFVFLSLAGGMVFLASLFVLGGWAYEWVFYSNNTLQKIHGFYHSETKSVKAIDLLPGDWDRVCFLFSHKAKDLSNLMGRELTISERFMWEFRADFVDFDHADGLFVYEKKGIVEKIELPGSLFSNKDQGCYSSSLLVIEKGSDGHLSLNSNVNMKK